MEDKRIQKRSSNIELFRIIVMFLILCGHYVFNSSLLTQFWGSVSAPTLFYSMFGMWGKVGINCFVLITGYFMCTSSITFRKFLKLYLELIFYSVIIWLIFVIAGKSQFSILDLFLKLTPFWKIESDNFGSAYMVWWLFIPFLNILIRNMGRQVHLRLVFLSILVFTLIPLLPFGSIAVNPICWFSVLYLIASYIRLYPSFIVKGSDAKFWGGMTLLFMALSLFGTMLTFMYANDNFTFGPYWLVMDSNAPFALLIGVSSFLFFKNIKLRHSNVVNRIAATTFGILLIHSCCEDMKQWLWEDVVNTSAHCMQFWYAILVCIVIFALCSFIDWMRIITIEKYVFNLFDKRTVLKK